MDRFEDRTALRTWGANLVSFGIESIPDPDEPFDFRPDAAPGPRRWT